MSIATKKPYIKEYIDALSDSERAAIITALNSSFGNTEVYGVYDLATGGPHTAISTLQNGVYAARLYIKANENICGILIKKTKVHFIAISTGAFPYTNLQVFEIVNSYLELRDTYLSVDELRNYCVDGGQEAGKVTSVNGKTGVVVLKDNDIEVYTDETGTKTVHSELVKHDEDLEDIHDLIPEEAAADNKLADKAWVSAQGGGGTKLYHHSISIENNKYIIKLISNKRTITEGYEIIDENNIFLLCAYSPQGLPIEDAYPLRIYGHGFYFMTVSNNVLTNVQILYESYFYDLSTSSITDTVTEL